MDTLHAEWHDAGYLSPPSARCGHISCVIDKLNDFGTELIVIHGGINSSKQALDDLRVLQVEQEEWLDLPHSTIGPAARAFHAACVINNSVAIFAGHVYIPEKKLLHQFNDLWLLDTNTWQWHRCETQPDHRAPCPRDRSSMIALDNSRLLIYGGTDTTGKRLDDAWVYDINSTLWSEISISGVRPRPRCCTSLFSFGNRVLLFGGDAIGMMNDLWSLRGLYDDNSNSSNSNSNSGSNQRGDTATTTTNNNNNIPTTSSPSSPTIIKHKDTTTTSQCKWTQLQLEGNIPLPRRGHAIAPAEPWGMLIYGGLSEQKSMLGIKKQLGHLSDLILLQRTRDALVWRSVVDIAATMSDGHDDGSNNDVGGGGSNRPRARELHSMVALKNGRFFLFGGTDGMTVLGDAWWLTLEDISPPPPDMITLSDLEKKLSISNTMTTNNNTTMNTTNNNNDDDVFTGGVLHMPPSPPSIPPPQPSPSSYWSTIPALAQQSVPVLATAMPAGLTSAISSLRDRIATTVYTTTTMNNNNTTINTTANNNNTNTTAVGVDAARAAASLLAPGKAIEDQQLLDIGRTVHLSNNNNSNDTTNTERLLQSDATTISEKKERISPSADTLVQSARAYFSSCQPHELKIGHLPCLLRDYRRLARIGWSMMISELHGSTDAFVEMDDIEFPGKYYHFMAEEVRMKDVGGILEDYRFLLAQAHGMVQEEVLQGNGGDSGGGGGGNEEREGGGGVIDE